MPGRTEPAGAGRPLPIFGIVSIAMTPLAVILGQIGGWIIEASVDRPGDVSLTTLFPGMGAGSARVLLACVVQAVAAGVIGLVTREEPRWLSALGVISIGFGIAVLFLAATFLG